MEGTLWFFITFHPAAYPSVEGREAVSAVLKHRTRLYAQGHQGKNPKNKLHLPPMTVSTVKKQQAWFREMCSSSNANIPVPYDHDTGALGEGCPVLPKPSFSAANREARSKAAVDIHQSCLAAERQARSEAADVQPPHRSQNVRPRDDHPNPARAEPARWVTEYHEKSLALAAEFEPLSALATKLQLDHIGTSRRRLSANTRSGNASQL